MLRLLKWIQFRRMEVAPFKLPIIPPASVVRTYPVSSLWITFGRILSANRLWRIFLDYHLTYVNLIMIFLHWYLYSHIYFSVFIYVSYLNRSNTLLPLNASLHVPVLPVLCSRTVIQPLTPQTPSSCDTVALKSSLIRIL